jgi:hypothetical protein
VEQIRDGSILKIRHSARRKTVSHVVLKELVIDLANAAVVCGFKVKNREGAVAETRCKTPRLRQSAFRKCGSGVGEVKQVGALIDVDLWLWKISVANAERGTGKGRPSRNRVMCPLIGRASATQRCLIGLRFGEASVRCYFC